MNRWDNDPNLWRGVMSNVEWAQANVPAIVAAIFANAENSERMDQWDWIKRAIHYAKTGALLGDGDDGTVTLASGSAKKSGK